MRHRKKSAHTHTLSIHTEIQQNKSEWMHCTMRMWELHWFRCSLLIAYYIIHAYVPSINRFKWNVHKMLVLLNRQNWSHGLPKLLIHANNFNHFYHHYHHHHHHHRDIGKSVFKYLVVLNEVNFIQQFQP